MLKIVDFGGEFCISGTDPPAGDSLRPTAIGRTPDPERIRPDASFKINDALREINREQPLVKIQSIVEMQLQIKTHEAIDEPRVLAVFESYIREHMPDPSVALALTTHVPEIEGDRICIAVDNQLQLDKLEVLKVHINNALMKALNNGFIALSFKLFDDKTSKEKKRLFTSSEKFEYFIQLNPAVAALKSVFGLELE